MLTFTTYQGLRDTASSLSISVFEASSTRRLRDRSSLAEAIGRVSQQTVLLQGTWPSPGE